MEDWKRVTHLQHRVVCLVQGGGVAAEESCLSCLGEAAGEAGRRGGRAAAEEPCSCPVQGRRVECSSGWDLGLRPVCGLTGPKKARWAISKPEYTYGYSYRHI
jgi:hypothetical protein